jgi:hypothetical protein
VRFAEILYRICFLRTLPHCIFAHPIFSANGIHFERQRRKPTNELLMMNENVLADQIFDAYEAFIQSFLGDTAHRIYWAIV